MTQCPVSLPEIKLSKRRFSDNLGHNILELYNVLMQIRLTTSKMKRDIQYSKLGIRVASRVAERLKTLLEKSQFQVERQPSAQSPSQKLNFGTSSSKNTQQQISNFSCPVQFLLDLFILFQTFCPGLQLASYINMYILKRQYKGVGRVYYTKE